jgi:organic hydroperoxide reductase OsmC/OhrA
VRPPLSSEEAVDPEEAFVAAVSSCHMLWFLSLAAAKKFTVERYDDRAVGTMGTFAEGKLGITKVELHPAIVFSGDKQPSAAEIAALHHEAHERCFIANSIKTTVTVEPAE